MRLKLDENVPASIIPLFEADGHDVDTVAGEGLVGREDNEVWAAVVGPDSD